MLAQTGGCPRFDEGAVQCVSPFYENLGYFAMSVLLGSFVIGLPAIAGLAFLIRDLLRWRQARA